MHYILPPDLEKTLTQTEQTPPYTSAAMLPYADAFLMEGSFGSLIRQHVRGDGFDLWLHIFQINHPLEVSILISEPTAILTYMLKGESSFAMSEQEDVTITEGSYYLLYIPPKVHPVQFEAGSYTIVQIELSNDLLQTLCFKHVALYEVWLSIEDNSPYGLLQEAAPINGRVKEALNRMLYCTYEEEERYLCQHARVLDLLILLSEDISDKFRSLPGGFSFSAEDIKAIKEAGDLKIERIGDSLPLKDIARKKNLHPKKLQAGFQLVYGKTTRELTTEARMEKAKTLLSTSNLSLAEIAYETGYSNDSAFIRAFKRYVGITPAAYRK